MSSATTTASSSHGSTAVAESTQLGDGDEVGRTGVRRGRAFEQQGTPQRGQTDRRRDVGEPEVHPLPGLRDPAPHDRTRRREVRRPRARPAPPSWASATRADAWWPMGTTSASAGASTPSTGTVAGGRDVTRSRRLSATATPAGERFSSSITVKPPPSATA